MIEKWIDVSAHQGCIDWPRVAASGVRGAVLRAGYGDDIRQQDTQFTANIRGALAAGLKVAVYWFSYADSVADALKEWAVCKQIIAPYKGQIKFVASDYEYDSYNYYQRVHGSAPSKALINQMVNAFLGAAKSDGWGTALYTNNDYRRNIFSAATLAAWDIWLADYTGGPDVPCAMQQTGSTGSVPGISGNVDMDTLFQAIGDIYAPAGAPYRSDTTGCDQLRHGGDYTMKVTCAAGRPEVVAGTARVCDITFKEQQGNNYFFSLYGIGQPGQATGIYINGGRVSTLVVRIISACVCDTSIDMTMHPGQLYTIGFECVGKPTVTAGTGGIATVAGVFKDDASGKWLAPVVAVRSGKTGIYVAAPGEDGTRRYVLKVVI
jgi:GH25 family lysozyme M1 (1,4-beta-N-acetylmuramidase)